MGSVRKSATEPYGFIKNLHLIEVAYFDTRLQEQTKLTLSFLIRYADQNGVIEWFSIKQTASRKGVTRRAIQNQIDKLIEYEYLACSKRKGVDWRNKYYLLFSNLNFDRDVTPLGDTHDTPEITPHVTQLSDTMKTNEIIKEKSAHTRDEFLVLVKGAFYREEYKDITHLEFEDINYQAGACWDYWASKSNFPDGCKNAAFKGWLRKGLRDGKIKTVKVDRKTKVKKQESDFKNPMQDWHQKVRKHLKDAEFYTWFRPCWLEGETLYTQTPFHVDYIRNHYWQMLDGLMPNVEVKYKKYCDSKELENA
jgi:hypothetical protein